jgi:hypothetical protein
MSHDPHGNCNHDHDHHHHDHHGNENIAKDLADKTGEAIKKALDSVPADQKKDGVNVTVNNVVVTEGHTHDHDHGHGDKLEATKFNFSGVKEHWNRLSTKGKFGAVLGSTVGVGVIMHGGLNIKRGLMGYEDTHTGEKRKGSISNLIVGVGETYVGALMLRYFLTANKSFNLFK